MAKFASESAFADCPPMHTESVALFRKPPVNIAEDKIMWVEVNPTFMNRDGSSNILFHISGTGSQYTDLSKSELYVSFQIVDSETGLPFEQNDIQSALPIDMIMHSMWGSVDVKLNRTLVSSSNTLYMYKSYIEGLLLFNENARKSQLTSIGFTGEERFFEQTHPERTPVANGLKERKKWFQKITQVPNIVKDDNDFEGLHLNPENPFEEVISPNNTVEFMGPLMIDLCFQERLILNRVDIDLKFWPNKDNFRLITHPYGKKAKIKIQEIKLYVCKVNIDNATFVAHNEFLKKDPQKNRALYPYLRTDITTHNILPGAFGDIIEDPFQGQVPNKLIIALVDSEAFSGDFHRNPLCFNHFDLDSIAFYVDGEATPRDPYEFDFQNGHYLEGLLSLYKVTGKLNENTDLAINRSSYRDGVALIGFDVDPTSAPDFSYIGKSKTGRGRVKIKFKKGLTRPVTVILYANFPEMMTINYDRIVTLCERDKVLTPLGSGRGAETQPFAGG